MKKTETTIALLTLLALAGASDAQEWRCPKCKKMVKGRFCPNHPEQKRPDANPTSKPTTPKTDQPRYETVKLCVDSGNRATERCKRTRSARMLASKADALRRCGMDHTPPVAYTTVTLCAASNDKKTEYCLETYSKRITTSKANKLGTCKWHYALKVFTSTTQKPDPSKANPK